jgi:AraC family transcriptional regulator, transcriptional activator of pobA
MRRFRSLLIDKADVRLPGLHVRTFALHRHQPEHASIEPHRHAWSQAILYLSGRGRQTVAESEARVEPGTLVLLPPRVSHAFSRSDSKTPLCVMIDFRLAGAARRGAVVCSLNRSELTHVRQQLAQLMKLQKGAGGALRWEGAVAVLQVLIALLRAAGWLERVIAPASGKPSAALQTMLQTMEHALPLGEVVKRSGYQRDHFNRLVKKETGLTLGQFRAQQRLTRAKQLLSQGMQVAAVATAVGLPDQSYFARWFRRQTGQVPSVWMRRK